MRADRCCGAVYCWGSNSDGRLGAGSSVSESLTPLLVAGMDSGVSAIHTNWRRACAIKSGTAFCWGDGGYGRLGNGAANSSNVPVQVSNIGGVTSIAGGNNHTCAVASGKYYCWGRNSDRQLGSDKVGLSSPVPVEVTGTKPLPVVTITPADSPSKLSRSGVAGFATVSCPAGATCSVATPERVEVSIRDKTFRVKILGAGSIGAGDKVKIRTRFGEKARERLGDKATKVKVKLTTTVDGAEKARKIRVKVEGPAASAETSIRGTALVPTSAPYTAPRWPGWRV